MKYVTNRTIKNAERFIRDYFLLSDDEYDMLFWYFWSLCSGMLEPVEEFDQLAIKVLSEGAVAIESN